MCCGAISGTAVRSSPTTRLWRAHTAIAPTRYHLADGVCFVVFCVDCSLGPACGNEQRRSTAPHRAAASVCQAREAALRPCDTNTLTCAAGHPNLCVNDDCAVCSIIRVGFKTKKAQSNISFARFGRGVYFSSTSSKSHDYNARAERGLGAGRRSKLVCTVMVGRGHVSTTRPESLTAPPEGYHSVIGQPARRGELHFDELCVYDDAAALPRYLVIYRTVGDEKDTGAAEEMEAAEMMWLQQQQQQSQQQQQQQQQTQGQQSEQQQPMQQQQQQAQPPTQQQQQQQQQQPADNI